MNFRPQLAKQVLAGEKTETRRLPNDNPRSPWFRGKCGYKLDQVFTVNPGRGRPNIGRARVIEEPRLEALSAIDDQGAHREGFADRDAFLTYIVDVNPGIELDDPVWVLRFEVVE